MSVLKYTNTAYAFNQPLAGIFPFPIVSKRAPLTTDKAPLGTVWIQPSTNGQWTLTSIVANVATWSSASGGTGDFTNLIVTGTASLGTYTGSPGSGTGSLITENGTQLGLEASGIIQLNSNIEVSILSSGSGADAILLGTTSGQLHLNSGGQLLLDTTFNNTEILLKSGTGPIDIGTDAAAKVVTIGNSTGVTAVNITGGTGGVNLASSGLTTVDFTSPTAASPTATVTSNVNVIGATFTGFTTASNGTQAFTISDNKITLVTPVLVTVSNTNTSGNNALMGINGITKVAGSIVVTTKNNGAGALGAADVVHIAVWVL